MLLCAAVNLYRYGQKVHKSDFGAVKSVGRKHRSCCFVINMDRVSDASTIMRVESAESTCVIMGVRNRLLMSFVKYNRVAENHLFSFSVLLFTLQIMMVPPSKWFS